MHCFRLNYNLDVADRLADEHALIGLYVKLLQNNPKSWLVAVVLWCQILPVELCLISYPNPVLSVSQH